jgi:hypothetical protein
LSVGTNGSEIEDELSSGTYIYNLECGNNCGNSDTDSITVNVACGTEADVKANESDDDITVIKDYTVSWESDGQDCTLNGAAVETTGSQLESAETSGDYPYLLSCGDGCGGELTDDVTVTVDLCGDGTCAAFEDCLNCPADCGECPDTWWQIWGGHLFGGLESGTAIASNVPADTVCVEPGCYPYLSALDRLGTTDSDGFAFTGGGGIDASGQISARTENTFALGSAQTRFKEKYAYFARQYSLGLDPEEDFAGQESDAQQPVYWG